MIATLSIMMAYKVITLRIESKSQLERLEELKEILNQKTYNKTILKLIELAKL